MATFRELVRITILISLISAIKCVGESSPEVIKQWSFFNYNFPQDWPSTNKDLFSPDRVVATGFEIGDNRIFLATPRLFAGVPATISTVSRETVGDSPVLKAYPDWSHHRAGLRQYNCSDIGLISVYRLEIDSCNRLWAVDSGVSRSLEDFEVTCPPKILIYDLNTDQVVRRIDFPKEVVRAQSLFTNIIIDETTSKPENHCDDAVVYISDTVEPAIVVYDSGRDLTWRLSHPSMYADDDFATSRIGNDRFNLSDGIVGMSFDIESKIVYYQPLATDRIFSISTAALRAGPLPVGKELPVKLVGKKSSQGIGLGASPYGGKIFFSPFTETAIAEYNPKTNEQRVLAYDFETLQFIADFKTSPKDPNALYFVSSRFHRFFLKNVSPFEVNTRIMRIGNVVQSLPYGDFTPPFQAIPQFSQNSISPFALPTVPSFFPPPSPQAVPSAFPFAAFPSPTKSNYASYSYNFEPQYPTKSSNFFPSIYTHQNHQPSPYQLAPTPSSAPISFPSSAVAAPSYNPVTSFFKFRGSSPYAFEQFSVIDKRSEYPFQQLNAGETLPQPRSSASSYMNFNYGDEVYRPTRFARKVNATLSL